MITKSMIGFMEAGLGGRPPRIKPKQTAIVPIYVKAAELGIGCHEKDAPSIPFEKTQMDYHIKCLQAAEKAGIMTHLVGVICNPAWAVRHTKEFQENLSNLLSAHRILKGQVLYMDYREPIKFDPEEYAKMLNMAKRMQPLRSTVFGCIVSLEDYGTGHRLGLEWLERVLKYGAEYDIMSFNWHGDAHEHLRQLPEANYLLSQLIGASKPRLISEFYTWGAANKMRPPQTDLEEVEGMITGALMCNSLGINYMLIAPALQDMPLNDGLWDGGGLLNADGKEKVINKKSGETSFDVMQRFLADMKRA